MSQMQVPPPAFRRLRARAFRFVLSTGGFAAAEAVLLALLLSGMAVMVSKILVPSARTAAGNLNKELAGGK